MKQILIILLAIISTVSASAQETPGKWGKILFTYEVRSPYMISSEGVFATASVFEKNFSNLKYKQLKSPSGSKMPFIPFSAFTGADRKRLLSILYQNETINGTYDKAANTTTLEFVKNDEGTRRAFAALGEKYTVNANTLTVDFNTKTEMRTVSGVTYTIKFKDIATEAVLSDDKLQAVFSDKKDRQSRKLSVTFTKGLNNKVTPGEIFTNNEYGIGKVESYDCTKTLATVKYE